jgi:folate-binding protein YgfZ
LQNLEKTTTQAVVLDNRALLRLAGPDARPLLQGLITADLDKLRADRALYSVLLTPQGKFLFDFMLVRDVAEDALLLETTADRLADLERRLMLYRLRAAVTIEVVDPQPAVAAVFGAGAAEATGLAAATGVMRREAGLVLMVDPRLAELGVRLQGSRPAIEAWLAERGIAIAEPAAFERHRVSLAVPEAGVDLVVDKTIMLEAGLDQLDAVAFDKGCFVGQELTARTRYRGLVKRRLVPVSLDGAKVETGLAVMAGEREAGEIRSVAGDMALAMLRLDRLGEPLAAGGGIVRPRPAAWQTDLSERLAAGQASVAAEAEGQ